MANHSHVPKFGNWDKEDNIPYTSYFENARKGKAGVRMNPNDPEENPEAFMIASGGGLDNTDHGDYQPIQASVNADSDKSNSSEKRLIEGNTYNDQKSGRNKSITTDFRSDRSKSDHSLLQPGHRHLKSDRKKGLGEGSNSLSPSVQGDSRQRSESHPSDEPHHRAASVPKFGAWDETDPASGEGFTVIFNKVKEEKQIASTKFPTVPAQANIQSDTKRTNGGISSRSKICCCLSPRTSD
ncbi:hypothetical protein Ddye_012868 [Dipteronia dyeriana]|uniref:RIN4 pathogenic type III effector avirulence factor Avr cleavage site domain-containing protein n=1 Tax=Dipteronia dyeriana TaxID=168575 RepID=A0AAD9X5C6_9ROSI|nr:hypothetical protein Ddye_012868 [Dipteronia dyeriana]